MEKHEQAVSAFLQDLGLAPKGIDLPACTAAFQAQMQAGLRGDPSPLLMLPTWLPGDLKIPTGGTALALDAGGTHLRAALVRFDAAGPQLLWQTTGPMPGTQGELTWQEFLCAVVGRLEPVLDQADRIGFCFSFPAEIQPDLDAVVLNFNKEVRIPDGAGMHLGRELKNLLPKPMEIAVLNDTAATLLGGMGLGGTYDGLIGFILGTGTNTCYPETVGQSTAFSSHRMLINTEAAGFDGFPRGPLDQELDRLSTLPGDHLYEKAVSGAYLGQLVGLALSEGATRGLLSDTLSRLPAFDMAAVDAFLRVPQGEGLIACACKTPTDRRTAEQICRACLRRAAKLVTANLAAVLLQGNFGRRAPARIVAEGSTFWKCQDYQTAIRQEMETYVSQELGVQWEFVSVEHANLIGAAAAAFRFLNA